ncbi:MAG: phospholipase D-like domain-containing protein [Cereibacter changlensis]
MSSDLPILRPSETCWRIERSDRLRVILDAADYFATIRKAVPLARHSVLMIGWDFDTRIELEPHAPPSDTPNRLGEFLNWVVESNPELRIHVLKWDMDWLPSLGRGSTPLAILDWMTDDRIRFKLDAAHPVASAHHQKIVVIDDTLAFCGGIDMTGDRWDTPDHLDDHPLRRRPSTRRRYGPWHDVTTAVNGDAARALGDLARERWKAATGEDLAPPPPRPPLWPEGLETTMRSVDVAVSRTLPPHGEREGVHEIEALYLAAIAGTRRNLYIESQYFASRKVAEAMVARLREEDPPEIVVVNPLTADGWLEEQVMGSSRAMLLQMLRAADHCDRFRMYTPVTFKGDPIYVHAKVLVMDDHLLRVGSSNLNNRSMGFDTECDLSVEVGPETPELAETIAGLRTMLLAEHLGVEPAAFEAAVARKGGSLIGGIEALRGPGRSLVPFVPPELNGLQETVLADNDLLDPERPSHMWGRRIRRKAARQWLPFFGRVAE